MRLKIYKLLNFNNALSVPASKILQESWSRDYYYTAIIIAPHESEAAFVGERSFP